MSSSQFEQSCPMCGEPVSAGADVCSACGESIKERRRLTAGERYLLRRFRNRMMILQFIWYIVGGFLITPLATDWLAGTRNGRLFRFLNFDEVYLSLVLRILGVALLAIGWACRRWPKRGLNGSLIVGYAALGCYLFLLLSFDHVSALLLAIPILMLAHIAHWSAHDVKSAGIALDDKR